MDSTTKRIIEQFKFAYDNEQISKAEYEKLRDDAIMFANEMMQTLADYRELQYMRNDR